MEKKIIKSEEYTTVTYRCKFCRNQFEGIVKKEAGAVRLKCSFCGHSIVVYL